MSEEITVTIKQLESLLKDREYAKEWKAMKYDKVLRENIKLKEEIKALKERYDYWNKEYINQDEKAEEYRKKYLKWKNKTKELRNQRKSKRKCFSCGRQGYHACMIRK